MSCDASRPLFFLHIPKTAGTSVVNSLVNRFGGGETLHLADGGAAPPRDLDQFGLVYGHAGFDFIRHFARRPKTLVVLREPIDRALSAFYYFRGLHPVMEDWLCHTLPAGLNRAFARFRRLPRDISLAEFIQREPDLAQLWLANAQARQLVGPPFVEAARPAGDELLRQATAALETIDVVGSTQRLDETFFLLEQLMNWPAVGPVPHQNRTRVRTGAHELAPELRMQLTEWNRVDLELFRRAQELLDCRLNDVRSKSVAEAGMSSRLPACEPEFSFAHPISGTGWYAREGSAPHWFCWMGLAATLEFRAPVPAERELICRVPHLLRREVLDQLTICVNGCALSPTFHGVENQVEIRAPVAAAVLQRDLKRMRVEFRAPGAKRPQELAPDNLDDRVLGLALSRVALVPLR